MSQFKKHVKGGIIYVFETNTDIRTVYAIPLQSPILRHCNYGMHEIDTTWIPDIEEVESFFSKNKKVYVSSRHVSEEVFKERLRNIEDAIFAVKIACRATN
jgi:hypothetical protein